MAILEMLQNMVPKQKRALLVAAALVVLVVCLFGSFLRAETVAEPVNLSFLTQQPQYGVQELRAWSQGSASVADESLKMDGYRIYYYKLDGDVLEAYIHMLEQNGFTLVDEHHQSSFLGSYQSYGLICNDASDVETRGQMYTGTPCHVNIWKDSSKWRVEVCDGLTMCDLGLRQDGTAGSPLPQGESLGAGLARHWGDEYRTTDGRLKATVGQAAGYIDGAPATAQANWAPSGKRITITAELSDELTAQISYRTDSLEQGTICLLDEMGGETVSLKLIAGEEEIETKQTGKAVFHSAAVRVMHVRENGETVLYLCAQPMDTEHYPQSIELLCAVNTTPQEENAEKPGNSSGNSWWDDDDGPFRPDHSKLDCLTCGGDGNCTTCGGDGNCTTCGGDGYTGFGGATAGCRSCHGNGNCRTCGGSGKR